jgi:hypothetical protein
MATLGNVGARHGSRMTGPVHKDPGSLLSHKIKENWLSIIINTFLQDTYPRHYATSRKVAGSSPDYNRKEGKETLIYLLYKIKSVALIIQDPNSIKYYPF